jgi:hypothetical protein
MFFSPGVSQVVEELDKVLAFNDLLISFKNHSDIDRLARGVGPVSLVGKFPDCVSVCFYLLYGSFLILYFEFLKLN